MGFELLCHLVLLSGAHNQHIFAYGDNKGVVEGWANFCSRNRHTNGVFCHIHRVLDGTGVTIHARYVRSAVNPADGPSRGIYDTRRPVLPQIELSDELREWLVDWDAPSIVDAIPWEHATPKPAVNPDCEHKQQREDALDTETAIDLAIFKDSVWED